MASGTSQQPGTFQPPTNNLPPHIQAALARAAEQMGQQDPMFSNQPERPIVNFPTGQSYPQSSPRADTHSPGRPVVNSLAPHSQPQSTLSRNTHLPGRPIVNVPSGQAYPQLTASRVAQPSSQNAYSPHLYLGPQQPSDLGAGQALPRRQHLSSSSQQRGSPYTQPPQFHQQGQAQGQFYQRPPNNMQVAQGSHHPPLRTSPVSQPRPQGFDGNGARRSPTMNRQLYDPGTIGGIYQPQSAHSRPSAASEALEANRMAYLNLIAPKTIQETGITTDELKSKERFRQALQKTAQGVIADYAKSRIDITIDAKSIRLNCYGSLANGFALKNSDMDLLLILPLDIASKFHDEEHGMKRALEKAFLDLGLGARLLTKTRVPILRVCEKPTPELYKALKDERVKWGVEGDELKKLQESEIEMVEKVNRGTKQAEEVEHSPAKVADDKVEHADAKVGDKPKQKRKGGRRKYKKLEFSEGPGKENVDKAGKLSKPKKKTLDNAVNPMPVIATVIAGETVSLGPEVASDALIAGPLPGFDGVNDPDPSAVLKKTTAPLVTGDALGTPDEPAPLKSPTESSDRPNYRDTSHLEFPKDGIGIQCDVNFSNQMAIHNTQMLRCYAGCDDRVRDMGLFVKAWAKSRKINSPYHGTLSSYGYILMVIHYLVNIANPPVLPNLQHSYRDPRPGQARDESTIVDGCDVRFWRDEKEIQSYRKRGMLTRNKQSLGSLLLGFFEYFGSVSYGRRVFHWTQDVLSLRTPGGLLPKSVKGWTAAKTTESGVKLRYLFAIEDPFELDHNIARTVVHGGIVAIRDEFRRAVKILNRIEDVPGCGWQWREDDGSVGENLFAEAEDRLNLQKPRFGSKKSAGDKTTDPMAETSNSAPATELSTTIAASVPPPRAPQTFVPTTIPPLNHADGHVPKPVPEEKPLLEEMAFGAISGSEGKGKEDENVEGSEEESEDDEDGAGDGEAGGEGNDVERVRHRESP